MHRFIYLLLLDLLILTNSAFSLKSVDAKNFITLNSGATLKIPQGFQAKRIDKEGEILKIEDPEKKLKIFLVETEGKDLSAAIDKAWNKVEADFKLTAVNTIDSIPPPGFDRYLIKSYSSDEENVLIQGKAKSKDNKIWILLAAGPQTDMLKRDSQLNSLFGSLKFVGMIEEDVSHVPLTSITQNIDLLNQFIIKGMRELKVPGLSIAIVENDKIVFEKGYGIKKSGESEPVTPYTLMKIGSITKPFTTLLMAKLIDEKKFKWHTRVRDLYPDFQVGDDTLSKNLTMEDLVSASTGLPREDFTLSFNYRHITPFQSLALIKPTTRYKETFQYNNQVYVVAGEVAAHTGEPHKPMEEAYIDLMQEKVFKPMEMNATTFSPQKDFAFPHIIAPNGKIEAWPLEKDEFTDFVKPAGGIWSNVHDMALFMITELQKGKTAGGVRVFSERNLVYRRIPEIEVMHNLHYGLGWLIIDYKGLTQITHGGATAGFASNLKFFPEKKCGFIILSNSLAGAYLLDALGDKIFELWFGSHEHASEKLDLAREQTDQKIEGLKKLVEPNAELMKSLLGKHQNKQLGIFEIKKINGSYILNTNDYKTKLMAPTDSKDEKSLVLIEPPFMGTHLHIINNDSFKIIEEQHTYSFKKSLPSQE